MTHEAVANAIRSRYGTLVEDAESVPTEYDNKPFGGSKDSIWTRCSILFGQGSQESLGDPSSNRYRYVGVLMVSIFVPIEKGDKEALALAQVVRDSFLSVTFGGVTFRTPSIIPVGKTGTWHQVNVNSPFYFDELA